MRTKQIQIYKFEELSDEAKEKAIEDTRNSDGYLNYDWSDYIEENFHERLAEISVKCDGFNFDVYAGWLSLSNAEIINPTEFIKKMGEEKWLILKNLEFKTEQDKDEFEDRLWSLVISSGSSDTYVCDCDDEELEERLSIKLNDIIKGFLNELREDYNYLNSDEAVKEHLIANEYEFLEDGGMY